MRAGWVPPEENHSMATRLSGSLLRSSEMEPKHGRESSLAELQAPPARL
jgi:hypothetical protein